MKSVTARYERGVLQLRWPLPMPLHDRVRFRLASLSDDPIEATRGAIVVSKRFARAITTPHARRSA